MIATILIIIFASLTILFLIKPEIVNNEILTCLFFVIPIIFCFMFLIMGYSGPSNRPYEKEKLEYKLEKNLENIDNFNWDLIKEAEEYNENVNFCNNMFCRFTIEDRSALLIEIENYLPE